MIREVHDRFPLRAVGLTCALVMSATLALSNLAAQPVDDTQLKQVIIFGRHSVRAPVASNIYLNGFSAQNFPDFGVAAGILTPNGEKLETILGGYYRQWLTQEGLLTGNDTADSNYVFFHANAIQRTVDTAQHLWAGLLPGAPVNVQYLTPSTAFDPLFDPVDAGVALLDSHMAIASVTGRLGGNPQLLASAYAPEMAARALDFVGLSGQPDPAANGPSQRNRRHRLQRQSHHCHGAAGAGRPRRAQYGWQCHRSFHHGVRRRAAGRLGPIDRRWCQPDLAHF